MRPVVVLVGAPGAGKTTVGLLLADRWQVGFRDTDSDIAARFGKPVAEIFYDEGEDAFRAAESAAVADALAGHAGVLALGGGAVTDPGTRRLLAGHTVVHLQVGVAAAAARVGMARDRPVLALNPRAQLKFLLAERAPLYAEVAGHSVTTDGRDPQEVAAEVARLVGR